MKEFEKIMNREGMGELMRPIKFIAKVSFPNPESPTILGFFKTKEARLKWYQNDGIGFEESTGKKVEFSEAPLEEGEKFPEDYE